MVTVSCRRLEEVTQDKMGLVTKLEEKVAQLQLQLDIQQEAYKVSWSIHNRSFDPFPQCHLVQQYNNNQ